MFSSSRALFWHMRPYARNLLLVNSRCSFYADSKTTAALKGQIWPNLDPRLNQIREYEEQGQLKDAMELCKQTITDYPEDRRAYDHLWSLWYQVNRIYGVPEHELDWYISNYQKYISPPSPSSKPKFHS